MLQYDKIDCYYDYCNYCNYCDYYDYCDYCDYYGYERIYEVFLSASII